MGDQLTTAKFFRSTMVISALPVLTGGPLSELRRMERKVLIDVLGSVYQLNDKMSKKVLKVILGYVECPMGKGYLCKFLFDNNHKRWHEFISVLDGYTHLALPLLKAILRCNSVDDIIAYWDGLLSWSNQMALMS